VTVGNDVYVDKGATLIDSGATVKNNVQATTPKGIGIGGFGSQPATVGGSVSVTGTSGSGPGTTTRGSNYICNARIGGNLTINSSASGAGPWIVGDIDEECSGGGNLIGRSLTAEFNKDRLDISDNRKGVPPYVGGITLNLTVLLNTVTSTSPIVESNFIGAIAACQIGTKRDGDGTPNIVGLLDLGCP
jgi:hypothetical protein